MTQELETKQNTELAELPMSVEDMAADSGKGGQLGIQDIGVPFLYILQTNSPQVNPDNPKYIKNASAGMIYVTVLEKTFEAREKGLLVIPCYYERLLVEWVPREKGGGFVASYDPADPIQAKAKIVETQEKKKVLQLPNGNVLQDTAYQYLLINHGPAWAPVVYPMKSTALKYNRNWNAALNTTYIPNTEQVAPRWLYQWNLKSQKDHADQYVFSSPLVTQGQMVTREQYKAAKDYAEIAASGLLRRKIAETEQAHGKDGRAIDDDVPF